jgi:hypothetical protein
VLPPDHVIRRSVVERCFKALNHWRGIAMGSHKLAGNHHAGPRLAATLYWLTSSLSNAT